jgi:putative acetyltransferase
VTTQPSSAGWRFRPSSSQDLDRLYEIWHASVLATHDFVSQSDLAEICVQVKNNYLPNSTLLVAVDERDQLMGFMGMNGHEVESLFIHPTCRGRGLGRAFIEQASAQSPYLEVAVNQQNGQAIAFYKAMGFVTYASSPTDDDGRPYPTLRMRRETPANVMGGS